MPDASQFTQIKRLQTSAAADKGAGPTKFRAPRFFDGWNPGQLVNFGKNALLSNKFIRSQTTIYKWIVSTFFNTALGGNIISVFVDSNDNVYLGFVGYLFKITPSGTTISNEVGANGITRIGPHLFVTTGNIINRYLASDLSLANTPADPPVAGGFQQITGLVGGRTIASDSVGRLLYVSNSVLRRSTISPTDGSSTTVDISGVEVNNARHLVIRVINGIEYAYIAEGGDNKIIRYNLSAASFPTAKQVIITGLNGPRGLAFESDTVIYISDTGNNRIMKFDTVTSTLTRVAGTGAASSTGNGGDALLATFNTPAGIAFSNDRQTLYVPEESSTTRDVAALTNTVFYE